jgi:hypothetical protein
MLLKRYPEPTTRVRTKKKARELGGGRRFVPECCEVFVDNRRSDPVPPVAEEQREPHRASEEEMNARMVPQLLTGGNADSDRHGAGILGACHGVVPRPTAWPEDDEPSDGECVVAYPPDHVIGYGRRHLDRDRDRQPPATVGVLTIAGIGSRATSGLEIGG